MTDWQITAKTIYCDSVQEEVTIIVKKDWSVQCTGLKNTCEGPECRRVTQYKESLMQEETIKPL